MKYEMTGSPFEFFSMEEIVNTKATGVQMIWTPEVIRHGMMMDALRRFMGIPLHSSSWFRNEVFNKLVKGDKKSCHLDGRATDIDNIDTTDEKLVQKLIIAWQVICSIYGVVGGIEIYDWGMHFDSHSDKFGRTKFRLKDNR